MFGGISEMKDRYDIKFSLSISEIRKIQKYIKANKVISVAKPYHWVLNIANLSLYSLVIGLLFFFAIALLLLLSTEIDPSMASLQRMSGTALAFIVIAVMALLLSSVLEKYFMKKYEHKEQNDETYIRHIKINRYFIEFIQDNSMYKVLWPRVNKVDVQEDLIFVHVGDNDFIIFPTRVFSSQEEFQQLYSFIKKQIERHTVP